MRSHSLIRSVLIAAGLALVLPVQAEPVSHEPILLAEASRQITRQRTDNGYERHSRGTTHRGTGWQREASGSVDRDAGTWQRRVEGSTSQGNQWQRQVEGERTEDGFRRTTTRSNDQGRSITREAEVIKNEDGSVTRHVERYSGAGENGETVN